MGILLQCAFSLHVQVPSSSEAALPVGSVGGGGREVPGRTQVAEAAEASKQRLQTLSQPCWEGASLHSWPYI